jgi:hypothetical protein
MNQLHKKRAMLFLHHYANWKTVFMISDYDFRNNQWEILEQLYCEDIQDEE